MSTRKVRDHYNRNPFFRDSADITERIQSDTPLGRFLAENKNVSFSRVFDVGCGAQAENITYLKQHSEWAQEAEFIGTDFSRHSLHLARSRHSGVQFIEANTENLPFRDSSADLVVATGTIHCMENPEKGLGEVVRVTRSGRHLYVSVYNRNNYYYWFYRLTGPLRFLQRVGLEVLIDVFCVPLYGVLYALGNALFLRKVRKIPYREIKMDFHDRFLVPIALFYTAEELRRMAGPEVEVVREGTYSWGIMLGMVFYKKSAQGRSASVA